MPCSDGRDWELREQNANLLQEYKEKVDNLTEMLCSVCAKIPFEDLEQKVRGWYSRHLDHDRNRVEALFKEKLEEFISQLKDMSGQDLREVEKSLENIKFTK